MPRPRVILPPGRFGSNYHCISRVVDRNFVFRVHERDVFRRIMRQVEAFSGVRVLTWTILSNHFHLLVHVAPRPEVELTDEEILSRCRALYSRPAMVKIELEFAAAKRVGGEIRRALRARFLKRMNDLSEFMKTLKQKFTSWFNRKHGRVGVLWESRFKSVAVEGDWASLLKVAAYIDLNPVRAGLAEDPKDYRWSGYSEAVAGNRVARRGLSLALQGTKPGAHWGDVAPRYRKLLYGIGEEKACRRGLTRKAVAEAFKAGGELSLAQLLRCRIRYFSDGMAIGSERFVDSVFALVREAFGKHRTSGARKMVGGDWGDLRVARALRIRPIDPGDP